MVPGTTRAQEALSATLSATVIRQVSNRVSMTSKAKNTSDTARRARPGSTGRPERSQPSRKAISASTRGLNSPAITSSPPLATTMSSSRTPESGSPTPICCCMAREVTPTL
jgi:hypothetical protein